MKHFKYLFLISLFFPLCAIAQVQQGYVRTIGRPGVPGKPLPGVTVRVRGMMNKILTSGDGYFELVMTGKKKGDPINFASISKNGYELSDRNFLNYSSVYSPDVTLEITMVDLEQLERDKLRIEENAYKVAEENYQKKITELEIQKQKGEMTLEEYGKELLELQNSYEKYLSLIGDMADRYARSDYDRMDSIDYRINLCIEKGDFDRADSLIHTVFDPYTVIERNRAAKEEIYERIEFAQSVIDKAQRDIAAIRRDSVYARRVIVLGENLADEYLKEGNPDKAFECLEQTIDIAILLYGEESTEAYHLIKKRKTIQE